MGRNRVLGVMFVAVVLCSLVAFEPEAQAQSSGTAPAVDAKVDPCPNQSWTDDDFNASGIDWSNPNYGNRAVIVLWPEWQVRLTAASPGMVDEMYGCLPWGWWYANVRSWAGIEDQLKCHDLAPLGIGTGPTWDLEGSRSTASVTTWVSQKCNW